MNAATPAKVTNKTTPIRTVGRTPEGFECTLASDGSSSDYQLLEYPLCIAMNDIARLGEGCRHPHDADPITNSNLSNHLGQLYGEIRFSDRSRLRDQCKTVLSPDSLLAQMTAA